MPLTCTLRRPRLGAPSSLSWHLTSWQRGSCRRKGHGTGLPHAVPGQDSPRHYLPPKSPVTLLNRPGGGLGSPVGLGLGCSSQAFPPTDTAGAQPRSLLPAPLPVVGPPLRDAQQPLPGARGALLPLPRAADVRPARRPADPVPGESPLTLVAVSVTCQFPRKTLLGFEISVTCLLFVFLYRTCICHGGPL